MTDAVSRSGFLTEEDRFAQRANGCQAFDPSDNTMAAKSDTGDVEMRDAWSEETENSSSVIEISSNDDDDDDTDDSSNQEQSPDEEEMPDEEEVPDEEEAQEEEMQDVEEDVEVQDEEEEDVDEEGVEEEGVEEDVEENAESVQNPKWDPAYSYENPPPHIQKDREFSDDLNALYLKVLSFVEYHFDGPLQNYAQKEGIVAIARKLATEGELTRIAGCIAVGGPNGDAGWFELFETEEIRLQLVVGIIWRALREHVFHAYLFGATDQQLFRLIRMDAHDQEDEG